MSFILWGIIWLLSVCVIALFYSVYRLSEKIEYLSNSFAIPQDDYGSALCGGCGRFVPLKSDRFSLSDHQCDFLLQDV